MLRFDFSSFARRWAETPPPTMTTFFLVDMLMVLLCELGLNWSTVHRLPVGMLVDCLPPVSGVLFVVCSTVKILKYLQTTYIYTYNYTSQKSHHAHSNYKYKLKELSVTSRLLTAKIIKIECKWNNNSNLPMMIESGFGQLRKQPVFSSPQLFRLDLL